MLFAIFWNWFNFEKLKPARQFMSMYLKLQSPYFFRHSKILLYLLHYEYYLLVSVFKVAVVEILRNLLENILLQFVVDLYLFPIEKFLPCVIFWASRTHHLRQWIHIMPVISLYCLMLKVKHVYLILSKGKFQWSNMIRYRHNFAIVKL